MNEQDTAIDLVQLALIAAEVGQSVGQVAHRFGQAVVVDDVGMRAVPAAEARRFFAERAAHKARAEEAQRQRTAEIEKKAPKVRVGVPAKPGADPVESLMSAASDWTSPDQDFDRLGRGGGTTLELFEEALREGRREIEKKKRRAQRRTP